MSAFFYAVAVYFGFSIVASLFLYWVISPDVVAAIDFLPARPLLSIFFAFVVGHAALMAWIFCTSKSFDVIISRSWLVFLSLIGLVLSSKIFCFGSPPVIEGNFRNGFSIHWTSAACHMDGHIVSILLILTIAFCFLLLLKFLSESYTTREGGRRLSEILRHHENLQ